MRLGFAERKTPVIYTVRRDHFVPSAEDEFGNRQIHFDLSMKNIIDWSDPLDSVFRQRLTNRIDLVTRPILKKLSDGRDRERQKETFEALSASEQSEKIRACAAAILKRYGYRYEGLSVFNSENEWYLLAGDCYLWVRFSYRYNTDTDMLHDTRYNLNVDTALRRFKRIREQWVYATPALAKSDEARDKLADFKKLSGNAGFTRTVHLSIPVLDPAFKGEVFLHEQQATQSVVERLWSGGEYHDGFLTKSPPAGSVHVQGSRYHEKFRFVYEGFGTRNVPCERFVHFIDRVDSIEDFETRLDMIVCPP
jgi:hypothetical protein